MRGNLQINLASEPFRRDRPALMGSAATAVLMVLVLGLQIHLVLAEREESAEAIRAVAAAEARLGEVAAEEARLQGVLRRPENAAVLERSVFLNALLLRKGISWTMIFSDLDEVLPHNVKLVQIRPQVDSTNGVQLEMVVASQSPEPVIDMLRALEGSPVFGATEVTASLPPTESEPLYRYRVNARYARAL